MLNDSEIRTAENHFHKPLPLNICLREQLAGIRFPGALTALMLLPKINDEIMLRSINIKMLI